MYGIFAANGGLIEGGFFDLDAAREVASHYTGYASFVAKQDRFGGHEATGTHFPLS